MALIFYLLRFVLLVRLSFAQEPVEEFQFHGPMDFHAKAMDVSSFTRRQILFISVTICLFVDPILF